MGSSFDGATVGAQSLALGTGLLTARGGMFVGGKLFYANDNGSLSSREFTDGTFASEVTVDLFGQSESDWALSALNSMFFDYSSSRVYYTLAGDSRLFYRGFTPDTTFFGNDEFVAEEQGDILWDDVRGMDVIDDHLYFTRSDGILYRSDIDGASVIAGTTIEVDSSRDWNNNLFTFLGDGMFVGQTTVAQFEFESSGTQTNGRFRTFEFDVAADEPVDVRLEWQDSTAQLNLFVQDASGATAPSTTHLQARRNLLQPLPEQAAPTPLLYSSRKAARPTTFRLTQWTHPSLHLPSQTSSSTAVVAMTQSASSRLILTLSPAN